MELPSGAHYSRVPSYMLYCEFFLLYLTLLLTHFTGEVTEVLPPVSQNYPAGHREHHCLWASRIDAGPQCSSEPAYACACSDASVNSLQLATPGLFATLWTIAHQAPLSMGFYRQEQWSGLSCRPPWDLPDSGIEPLSLRSPALQADSLPTEPPGKPENVPVLRQNSVEAQPETLLDASQLRWDSTPSCAELSPCQFAHLYLRIIWSIYFIGPR